MAGRGKDSFLVTLWSEERDAGTGTAPPWRGSVEHLSTKRRLYFSAPSELIGFLGRHLQKTGTRGDDRDT
jgi:hypothetical protein